VILRCRVSTKKFGEEDNIIRRQANVIVAEFEIQNGERCLAGPHYFAFKTRRDKDKTYYVEPDRTAQNTKEPDSRLTGMNRDRGFPSSQNSIFQIDVKQDF
jgi:hypothetical protein